MKYDTAYLASDTYTNACLLGGVHSSQRALSARCIVGAVNIYCLLQKPMITLCIVWCFPTVVCGVRVR